MAEGAGGSNAFSPRQAARFARNVARTGKRTTTQRANRGLRVGSSQRI